MTWFRIDNLLLDYHGIRAFALIEAKKYGWNSENTINILPIKTLEQNIKSHPVRILREKGYKVENITRI